MFIYLYWIYFCVFWQDWLQCSYNSNCPGCKRQCQLTCLPKRYLQPSNLEVRLNRIITLKISLLLRWSDQSINKLKTSSNFHTVQGEKLIKWLKYTHKVEGRICLFQNIWPLFLIGNRDNICLSWRGAIGKRSFQVNYRMICSPWVIWRCCIMRVSSRQMFPWRNQESAVTTSLKTDKNSDLFFSWSC